MLFLTKTKFTKNQHNRLSNIFDGVGQVIFAVAVVTPAIGGLDNSDLRVLLLGIVVAIFCWITSIRIAKKG